MSIPIPALFGQVVITAGVNDGVSFSSHDPGGGGVTRTYTGTVAAGTYTSITALMSALSDALYHATRSGGSYDTDGADPPACVVSGGIVSITFSGIDPIDSYTLRWHSGSASVQALATILGFSTAADLSQSATIGVATLTAPLPLSTYWTPDVPVRFDSGNREATDTVVVVSAGGQSRTTRFATLTTRTIDFELVAAKKTLVAYESVSGESLQRVFDSVSSIARFRWYPDRTDYSSGTDYFLTGELAQSFEDKVVKRMYPGVNVYAFGLSMGLWQS